MCSKKMFSMMMAAVMTVGVSAGTVSAETDYEPVTITLNLQRSGLGENVEYTFTEKPSAVVASGEQMADLFFDLGLEDQMAGYTKGNCWSTKSEFPASEKVPQLLEPGQALSNMSKEKLLETGCDFLIGWDSVFADKSFNKDFCEENGIAMYFPYVCSDQATFEDLYKDYETLGKIFQAEDVAAEKVQAMKDKIQSVKETIGEDAYKDPVEVFVYDSGEDAPFTACQGMPGDILKAVPYLPDKVGMFLFKFFQILIIINRCFCDQTFHQTAQVDIKPDHDTSCDLSSCDLLKPSHCLFHFI